MGAFVYNGHLDVFRSTISGNAEGGVAATYYGTVTVLNSTISGNGTDEPGLTGGGAYGEVDVIGSTITGNVASEGGGVFAGRGYGPVRISGSIVAGNFAERGSDCSPKGVISKGENVFGSSGCDPQANDIVTADPGLRALADNGGPTLTHALKPGSPALDHAPGLDLDRDQRGVLRGRAPDSGSFERG